jgi:undecaprenyl-diphosphatase
MLSLFMDMDLSIIHWVQTHLQDRMFGKFMEFISIKGNFVAAGVLVAILILWTYRLRGLAFLLAGGIAVGMNDWVSHHIFKEWIARPRPCHVLESLKHITNCSNSFSFPSNHASNTFAFALLGTLCFRNWVLLVYTFALLVGYSRVYLGVHYPSDILGGAVLGSVMGYLGYKFYSLILRKTGSK